MRWQRQCLQVPTTFVNGRGHALWEGTSRAKPQMLQGAALKKQRDCFYALKVDEAQCHQGRGCRCRKIEPCHCTGLKCCAQREKRLMRLEDWDHCSVTQYLVAGMEL
mmetsp:Transcript_23802/g.43597  ORF Transcript_23802/g.43597 Transcript_23802/m.43597 type:complete len:107 (+) Transcript_23802:660-980(+)